MWALGLSFITSPEYSLQEGIETLTMKSYDFTMNAMYDEYKSINLSDEIESIEVPIYFFEGKYDKAIPFEPVEEFYNNLEADNGKYFIVFENSAHFPMVEEKKKYNDLLISIKHTL